MKHVKIMILLIGLFALFVVAFSFSASADTYVRHFYHQNGYGGFPGVAQILNNDTSDGENCDGVGYILCDEHTLNMSVANIDWVHIRYYAGGRDTYYETTPIIEDGVLDTHGDWLSLSYAWYEWDITNDTNAPSTWTASTMSSLDAYVNQTEGRGQLRAVQVYFHTSDVLTNVYVDDDASSQWYTDSAHFRNISDALDSGATDTCYIYDGYYNESSLEMTMNVIGNSSDTVTVVGNNSVVFYFNDTYNINLKNLTLKGGNTSGMICINDTATTSKEYNISNLEFRNCTGAGIIFDETLSRECDIYNCTFYHTIDYDIHIQNTTVTTIKNCTFSVGKYCNYSIRINQLRNVEISNNSFGNFVNEGDYWIYASCTAGDSAGFTIDNNTFVDNGDIYLNGFNLTTSDQKIKFYDNYKGECDSQSVIRIDNSDRVNIYRNDLYYGQTKFIGCSDVIVQNNSFENVESAVELDGSSNFSINNNSIFDVNYGLETNGSDITIENNSIIAGYWGSPYFGYCIKVDGGFADIRYNDFDNTSLTTFGGAVLDIVGNTKQVNFSRNVFKGEYYPADWFLLCLCDAYVYIHNNTINQVKNLISRSSGGETRFENNNCTNISYIDISQSPSFINITGNIIEQNFSYYGSFFKFNSTIGNIINNKLDVYWTENDELNTSGVSFDLDSAQMSYKGETTNIIGGTWFSGNYWYDYGGNDTNDNGLGETPYRSNTYSYDLAPMENSNETILSDVCSKDMSSMIAENVDAIKRVVDRGRTFVYYTVVDEIGKARVYNDGRFEVIVNHTIAGAGSYPRTYSDILLFGDYVVTAVGDRIVVYDEDLNYLSTDSSISSDHINHLTTDGKYIYAGYENHLAAFSMSSGSLSLINSSPTETSNWYLAITADISYIYAGETSRMHVWDFDGSNFSLLANDYISSGDFEKMGCFEDYVVALQSTDCLIIEYDNNGGISTLDNYDFPSPNTIRGLEITDDYIFVFGRDTSEDDVITVIEIEGDECIGNYSYTNTTDMRGCFHDGRYLHSFDTSENFYTFENYNCRRPFPMDKYPKNGSVTNSTPTCKVIITDVDDNSFNYEGINVTFQTNESGSWVTHQVNQTGETNDLLYWTFPSSSLGKHWWRIYIDDGTYNISRTYKFTVTDYPSVELTSPSVSPTSGVASYTTFHFNVTWSHPSNTPDDGYLVVNISKDGWHDNSSMSYVSGDNTTGAVYTYSTALSASSSYNYTFYGYTGSTYNSSGPHANPDVESQSLSFTITTSSDGDFFFKDWVLSLTGVGLTTEYNVSEDNQTGALPALNITNTGNIPLNFSINWSSDPGSGIIMKWNSTNISTNHGTNTIAEDPSSTQIITDLQPLAHKKIWLWMDFTNVQAQESSANIQIVSWT